MNPSPKYQRAYLTRSGRRRRVLALAALGLLLCVAVRQAAARADATPEFRVIVNFDNSVTGLPRDFLADAFLKRTTRWSGGEVLRPVDQRSTAPVRQRFSDSVLHRSVAAVKNYWQQRIFSGRDLPPPELDSDEAVLRFVSSHHGAIGYVSGGAKLERVKPVVVE
jgi:ABC-type phosphate transport system substrate-binding protein